MFKLKYILITILLALIILPALWATARGSLLKVSSTTNKGLVGHWALDNVTGAQDKTPYSNNGTGAGGITIGGATDQHGQANRATSFDGTDDYISLSPLSYNNTDVTVTLWFKLVQQAGRINGLINYYDGVHTYGIGFDSLGALNVGTASDQWSHTYTTEFQNVWTHLAVVKNSSGITQHVYINGIEINDNQGNYFYGNRNEFAFGVSDTQSYHVNGSIDDVRIYNRALSSTEITSLYNSYRPKQAISSLQKGLVGQWKLDQASNKSTTVTADATPYGNDGTGAGSITLGGTTDQHGQANKATSFDGSSQYVNNGNGTSLNVTGALSFGGWFKTSSLSNSGMVAKSDYYSSGSVNNKVAYHLRMTAAGLVQFVIWDNSKSTVGAGNHALILQSISAINDGNWHKVMGVYDGGTTISSLKIYIDGSLASTTDLSEGTFESLDAANTPLVVGIRTTSGSPNEYFNGSIADVRVYNRALSSTEITSLYNSYRPTRQISSLYKGLVLDMPLAQKDLKSTTVIADKTPQGNDGTLVGSPTFTTDRHGQSNKAMSFNGTDDYVDVGEGNGIFDANLTGLTISAWVKLNNFTDYPGIVGKGNADSNTSGSYLLYYRNSSNKFSFLLYSGSTRAVNLSGGNPISTGVWYHVVVTWTASTSSYMYVNGVEVDSDTIGIPATIDNTAYKLLIGSNEGNGSDYDKYPLNGSIANVKVWNRALSAAEVQALYQQSY